MTETLGDGPIDPALRDKMNAIAKALDAHLNDGGPRKTGFMLLVFPLEGHEGRANYISNGQRKDVVTLLKEQVKRFEADDRKRKK